MERRKNPRQLKKNSPSKNITGEATHPNLSYLALPLKLLQMKLALLMLLLLLHESRCPGKLINRVRHLCLPRNWRWLLQLLACRPRRALQQGRNVHSPLLRCQKLCRKNIKAAARVKRRASASGPHKLGLPRGSAGAPRPARRQDPPPPIPQRLSHPARCACDRWYWGCLKGSGGEGGWGERSLLLQQQRVFCFKLPQQQLLPAAPRRVLILKLFHWVRRWRWRRFRFPRLPRALPQQQQRGAPAQRSESKGRHGVEQRGKKGKGGGLGCTSGGAQGRAIVARRGWRARGRGGGGE